MKIAFVCVVLGLLAYRIDAAFTVKYMCEKDQKLTFTASGTDNLATVHVENKGNTCGSSASGADSKAFNLASGKVTDEVVTATQDFESACGYTDDGNNVRTLTLILSTTATVTIDSGKAEIKCTKDQATSQTISVASGSINGQPTGQTDLKITGEPTLKIAKNDVTAADAVGQTQPTTATLGELIRIVGYIDTQSTAKKLLLINCKATPNAADTPVYNVIDNLGCADTTNAVFTAKAPPVVGTGTTDKYVLMGPAFKAFKTYYSDVVKFSCTVNVCVADDTTSCVIPGCTAAGGGRRRRAAPPRSLNNATLSSSVIIVTSKAPHLTNDGLHGNKNPMFSSCLSHVSFISVVAILAVLLVVSLAVSVFFCSKLIRQNNNNQQKEAYPNPAYKA